MAMKPMATRKGGLHKPVRELGVAENIEKWGGAQKLHTVISAPLDPPLTTWKHSFLYHKTDSRSYYKAANLKEGGGAKGQTAEKWGAQA